MKFGVRKSQQEVVRKEETIVKPRVLESVKSSNKGNTKECFADKTVICDDVEVRDRVKESLWMAFGSEEMSVRLLGGEGCRGCQDWN